MMNVKTTIATLSVLSALSFGAFAADSINAEQAKNLQPMGLHQRQRRECRPNGYQRSVEPEG